MASVAKNKTTGDITIQFKGLDGKRKTLRLGRCKQRTVTTIKTHLEELLEAHGSGRSIYDETQVWLKKIGAANGDLYEKLAKLGLAPKLTVPQQVMLGSFLDGYIASRTDVESATVTVYGHTRRCLIEYFGPTKPLAEITAGDADDFRRWLTRPVNADEADKGGQGLSDNTCRRRCGIAKQYFRDALRRRLIAENPFAEMKGTSVLANRSRDYFVSRKEADMVIEACPDSQWRLLFALSRYGGLRCPSEHLRLTWGDIDWNGGRMVVHSSKTAHHEGKELRIVPIFPELRPYLEAVYSELVDDPDFDPKEQRVSELPIITRYRQKNINLRTQLHKIIRRAGLKPWPKLFQNLRATRATELADQFPTHVAAGWLGHSTKIADKHYRQTTEDHFAKATTEPTGALQKALQNTADVERNEANDDSKVSAKSREIAGVRVLALDGVGDTGLEPVTSAV